LQVRFLSALRVSATLARHRQRLTTQWVDASRRTEGNQVASMVQDEPQGEVVPAGGTAPREKKANVFARIALFIRQVFAELRKVVTPTRQELLKYTAVVLGFVVVMMAIVYGLDVLFVWITAYVFGVPGA
jgi:preprotein translocase subunit SecE